MIDDETKELIEKLRAKMESIDALESNYGIVEEIRDTLLKNRCKQCFGPCDGASYICWGCYDSPAYED